MSHVFDRLGFGCVAVSALQSAGAARRLLESVFELGIRHFDTAPLYGQGYSERVVGDFLRDKRDRVTVATKFGLSLPLRPLLPPSLALPLNYARRHIASKKGKPAGLEQSLRAFEANEAQPLLAPRCIKRADIEASFERSTRSLRTDYFDLYLLHEGLPSFLDDAAFDYLLGLKNKGRVHRIGLAAGGHNYLSLDPAQLEGWDVLQYEFGPAWPGNSVLLERFPDQLHIFHSCLKGLPDTARLGIDRADLPGRILAECLAAHSTAKVLFSSTNLRHIRDNLRTLARL